MTPTDIVITILGTIITVLLAANGWQFRRRLDSQDQAMTAMQTGVSALQLQVAALIESQKAVVSNQAAISQGAVRLLDDVDELAEVSHQLELATALLRERYKSHDDFLTVIRTERNARR